MRIHFIYPQANMSWPQIKMLREEFPDATFTCGGFAGFSRYQRRIQLLLRIPLLIRYAFKSLKLRCLERPLPDYCCVTSDAELLGCAIAQLFMSTKIPIILVGFIYTPRKSNLLTALRKFYFRRLLSLAAGVTCYSTYEREYLPKLLGTDGVIFASSLYGSTINLPTDLARNDPAKRGYIVSAGRSGRDYALLCSAVAGLPVEVHIICDSEHALKGIELPSNVTVLRNCYYSSYYDEISRADFALLPLRDQDLSSGQMVLVDAMALGKATIITKTKTTIEYGKHLSTCYFIEPHSADDIRSAIEFFYQNPRVVASIEAEARLHYQNSLSMESFVSSLAGAIREITLQLDKRSAR